MTTAAHEARLADEADYAEILRLPDRKRLPLMAELGKRDLYFLLTVVLDCWYMRHDWLYARCREVEAAPDGYLDLWAREHGKSTIITYGLTLKDIINNPEITIGIFSYKKDNALGFVVPLKQTMETNRLLKVLWPEIFWGNPERDSPLWSKEQGLIVKRQSVRKEPTVSGWGLVQGQPVGSHFDVLVYDDIVTGDTVTEGTLHKTTEAWAVSLNLGTIGGRIRAIGTRWHYADTYADILGRQALKPRIYPATMDGTEGGEPRFMSREELDKRRVTQTPYAFASQMLLNPVASSARRLNPELLNYYEGRNDGSGQNIYILVDPAGSKKKTSDFTVIAVVGVGQDGNKYLLDLVRDRLNLAERTGRLFELHRKWRPNETAYEKYGKDSDVEAVKIEMERRNYRFSIKEVGGTRLSKEDRIERMLPDLESGRWWWPQTLWTARDGKQVDLIRELVEEEMRNFPFALHDDGLDALSRIYDLNPETPFIEGSVRGRLPMLAPHIAERHFDPRAW